MGNKKMIGGLNLKKLYLAWFVFPVTAKLVAIRQSYGICEPHGRGGGPSGPQMPPGPRGVPSARTRKCQVPGGVSLRHCDQADCTATGVWQLLGRPGGREVPAEAGRVQPSVSGAFFKKNVLPYKKESPQTLKRGAEVRLGIRVRYASSLVVRFSSVVATCSSPRGRAGHLGKSKNVFTSHVGFGGRTKWQFLLGMRCFRGACPGGAGWARSPDIANRKKCFALTVKNASSGH